MVIYNSGNTLLPNDQKVVLREVSKAQRSQNSLVTYRDAPTNDNFNKLYDKFYLRLGHTLRSACHRLALPTTYAEDALQDTFIRLKRNIDSYRGETSAYSYIYQIAITSLLDIRRGYLSQSRLTSRLGELRFPDPGKIIRKDDPFYEVSEREEVSKLLETIDRLPNLQRDVVQDLVNIEEGNFTERAERLDMPVNRFRSSLVRARNSLETWLRRRA